MASRVHDYWLRTERCSLRRFTTDDRDWLRDLYADPEVTRYLGGVKSVAEVNAMLETRILQYYEKHPGLGIWMTVENTTGTRVGFHLLNHIQGETIIQVGYTLAREAWGRGLAAEMAKAILHYGFADLGLPRIAGMTSMGNVASQRVLGKIGLERRGERAFPHPAYAAEGPLAWFEREADAWLAEHAPSSSAGEGLAQRPPRSVS
ncbi:MAG: GNAT family N-acetyltransferase [Acidobacteria bacterium]|nr:GNAT family N-acetyltransferase [Acidobacteriota bacterium]